MDAENNNYHISFFKPTNDSTRHNRNMIIQLVSIWAVAIFGFQLLIKILEKPVPEQAYLTYETYWADIKEGTLSDVGLREVGKSTLSVLGKVAIRPEFRAALDNAFSWMAWNLADSTTKILLRDKVSEFEKVTESSVLISDQNYLDLKNDLVPVLGSLFEIHTSDVRRKIAPLELKSSMMESFSEENVKLFEEAMDLYLIHNRSVLTDTKFLGFPFHYFYTAVFLLVLFVGLCWLYCVRTDMFNKRYGIED